MIDLYTFATSPKPDWCSPNEVAVMCYLLSQPDLGGGTKLADIAAAVGLAQVASVRNALKRLEVNGWVKTTLRLGIGLPNVYTVLLKSLP